MPAISTTFWNFNSTFPPSPANLYQENDEIRRIFPNEFKWRNSIHERAQPAIELMAVVSDLRRSGLHSGGEKYVFGKSGEEILPAGVLLVSGRTIRSADMTLVRRLTVMRNLFQSLSLRFVFCAGVVAAGLTSTPVSAGYQTGGQSGYGIGYSPDQYRPEAYQPDQYHPAPYSQKPACHYKYKEITVYELRDVPEVHWITKYDHCGKPYQVKVVSYHTIKVPVTKRIKVPC